MFTKRTIKEYGVANKKVLVCVDYNVPLDSSGKISDDYRIKASLPTLNYLLEHGCSLVLMSHLGRPKAPGDPNTSLKPVAERLSQLIGREVQFAPDCVGESVKTLSDHLQAGQLLMLENVRYHSEEESNDPDFARRIVDSTGAELYVQECFGTAHRAHASTNGVPQLLPAVAGLLVEKEVDTITDAMQNPARPLMVVIGGAKISDKIELLNKFIEIADFVAVVGAMANTFLQASGIPIGVSLTEPEQQEAAKDLLEKAQAKAADTPFTFFLPKDVVVAKKAESDQPTRVVDLSHHNWADINAYPKQPDRAAYEVAADEAILDIGPFSAAYIAGAASFAKTAVWNGTCGVTEIAGLAGAAAPFQHGTRIVVDGLVGDHPGTVNHPYTVVGGGDTVSFIESVPGLRERFGHVSTGGGASLELMAGHDLPGVSVLMDKE